MRCLVSDSTAQKSRSRLVVIRGAGTGRSRTILFKPAWECYAGSSLTRSRRAEPAHQGRQRDDGGAAPGPCGAGGGELASRSIKNYGGGGLKIEAIRSASWTARAASASVGTASL